MARRRQGILSKDLRWPKPKKAVARRAVAAEAGMERFIAASGGLPRIVDPKSVKDEAIRLLRIAAEVEHALMVEYLYAAFTLRPGPGTNKYRNALVTIAKQEMGHFVTVQHLLCLLGAPPHLDRDELLPASGKEPAAFVLEPVTLNSLGEIHDHRVAARRADHRREESNIRAGQSPDRPKVDGRLQPRRRAVCRHLLAVHGGRRAGGRRTLAIEFQRNIATEPEAERAAFAGHGLCRCPTSLAIDHEP